MILITIIKIMIIYIIYDKNDITDYKINMFVHIEI